MPRADTVRSTTAAVRDAAADSSFSTWYDHSLLDDVYTGIGTITPWSYSPLFSKKVCGTISDVSLHKYKT